MDLTQKPGSIVFILNNHLDDFYQAKGLNDALVLLDMLFQDFSPTPAYRRFRDRCRGASTLYSLILIIERTIENGKNYQPKNEKFRS